ncbi:xanthine and CO dehydrogenases maturation factor, XdhC/CoxF family [Shewanella psychrophila]|uniref:Xanthine and CO dehydrogenases maturation factor, XdhC/CoxF family n=1 Tax=Shewanella psychrophila TaxID=225848 RepID=A0A1S6HSR9_9GAMM|nr:XdhC family protein [Shewanella psychrophila]AQS38551.1 xanthine and CO dehydrogenases maturation factor, XdhC/CoxF family [Shewanella psychrophila]
MQLTDISVLETVSGWLTERRQVWLCTVVSTYGSAPRPIGALFATDGKSRAGSISGGCLEEAFLKMINQGEFTAPACLFDYGKHHNEEGSVFELPCGGTIRLLIEKLEPSQESINQMSVWYKAEQSSRSYCRRVNLMSGLSRIEPEDLSSNQAVLVEGNLVSLHYSQAWSVLLLGISLVSQHVAQLARLAGYTVKICDIRKELAGDWEYTSGSGGVDVSWQSPDQFVEQNVNSCSVVLALAHDPRVDDLGLMAAFESDAFYIGAMGSKRTTATRIERLKRIGEYSEQDISRLHAPIGLDIGSKTPVEIAISIMAEVIAKRNGIKLAKSGV